MLLGGRPFPCPLPPPPPVPRCDWNTWAESAPAGTAPVARHPPRAGAREAGCSRTHRSGLWTQSSQR